VNKVRVAIFSDSYSPQINGVVTQIKNISGEFLSRGHEVMIVGPSPDMKFSEKKSGKLMEVLLPSIAFPTYKDYRITHFISPRVFRELKKFRPDVVHVHTPFGVGWLGVNCAKRLRAPLVGTYHTLLPEFMAYLPIPFLKDTTLAKTLAWKYTNFFYNSCAIVTTPTSQMKEELSRNGVTKEIIALPNAIDFAKFNKHAKKKYEAKKPRLIYFGRVSYEKNIEVLLHALKSVIREGKNVSLTITGSGPATDYLKAIAEGENISAHVTFQGALGGDELSKHVASHDIFVTASTIETQGLTVLEAMAAGLPCIGADYLGIKDSIKEGVNGYLFKPYDFHALALKIKKLTTSSALRKKMGKNAVATAKKYSVQKIADETEALYQMIMKK